MDKTHRIPLAAAMAVLLAQLGEPPGFASPPPFGLGDPPREVGEAPHGVGQPPELDGWSDDWWWYGEETPEDEGDDD